MSNRLTIAVLTLVVLALLTGHFFIGKDYLEQRQGQQQLDALIEDAVQLRAQTPAAAPELQASLADAEAELIAAGHALPVDLNSTGLINDILMLAEECGVSVIPLVTQPWDAAGVGRGYEVFRVNLTISGEYPDLYRFVDRLESDEFASLATENIDVVRFEATEEDEAATVRASLDVAVYAQFPAAAEGETS